MRIMAARKKKDRHKTKPFTLRLNERIRTQLEALADQNATTITMEIAIAIRERLERNGKWPPPESK